jgi:hypothetical protein
VDVTWDLDAFVGGRYAFEALMAPCPPPPPLGGIAGK